MSKEVMNKLSSQVLAVSPRVTLAGALDSAAVSPLDSMRALVVDLRGADEEGVAESRAWFDGTAVQLETLPLGSEAPTGAAVSQLAALLAEEPEQPVVVHCRSGNRAGLLWASYLLERGAPLPEALAAVEGIVTSDEVRAAIRTYADERADRAGTVLEK